MPDVDLSTVMDPGEFLQRVGDALVGTDLTTTIDAKQPLDSDLTAIAALSTTAFGRSLLTLADAAAAGWTTDAELTAAQALKVSKTGDTMTGALTVIAATAAGHASRVSAINATTGRVAVDGMEIGDTGWRNVSGDMLDLTNWRLRSPGGLMHLRRIGNMVMWRCHVVSTAANTQLTNEIPVGFLPDTPSLSFLEPVTYSLTADAAIPNAVAAGAYTDSVSGKRIRLPSAAGVVGATLAWKFSYTAQTAWPTTLPGTPALVATTQPEGLDDDDDDV